MIVVILKSNEDHSPGHPASYLSLLWSATFAAVKQVHNSNAIAMKMPLILFALIWLPFSGRFTEGYHFTEKSMIAISGSSSLHGWTMKTRSVKGMAAIEITAEQMLSIDHIQLSIPVESLKSGKRPVDRNAYDALKSDQYPDIHFRLMGFDQIRLSNGQSALTVNGDLTIAGKTRQEAFTVQYGTDEKGQLYVKGSKKIKMTDYGVTPPKVMLGAVRTSDEITIDLNLVLAKK